MILTNFKSVLPKYNVSQETNLKWLIAAYSKAASQVKSEPNDTKMTPELIARMVHRFGCKSHQVSQRFSDVADFTHTNWEQMDIFDLTIDPQGASISRRMAWYFDQIQTVFSDLFLGIENPPDDLIHVTCTGYHSPSSAQKFVQSVNWQQETEVTHAYHMGCFAAFPAIKMATGYLAQNEHSLSSRVDVVHTETCTLHLNPLAVTAEQIVVQTLFSDGYIKYSVVHSEAGQPGLRQLAQLEELISDTESLMQWGLGPYHFHMTLSETVPEAIKGHLAAFLGRLGLKTGYSADQLCREAIFAIHPGGPRIIDQIETILNLKASQTRLSRKVLFERGNMSSATVPHVWLEILDDRDIPKGCLVVSLSFGPGLTISGCIFEKV